MCICQLHSSSEILDVSSGKKVSLLYKAMIKILRQFLEEETN